MNDYRRKVGTKGKPKEAFLIVCEGEKTEPSYFDGFRIISRISSIHLKIIGTGYNTTALVEEAIRLKKEARKNGELYEQVWCVLDRDSFIAGNFNGALALANRNGIDVAYSNEAFELWYLLHFCYLQSALTRQDYIERLSGYLGFNYKKNNEKMYEILLNRQADAIRNAERLLSNYSPINPEQDSPSTNVHQLVSILNQYLPTNI